MKFRILRILRNGQRIDVPSPRWCSDSTFTYGDTAEAAIANARSAGATGDLVAVHVDERDREVVAA